MKHYFYSSNFTLVKGDEELFVTLNASSDSFKAFADERRRLFPDWRLSEY